MFCDLVQTDTIYDTIQDADLWSDVHPPASRRLLAAALDCFAARGYNATTTREIATRAGLSPGAVYVHFPSKAELLYRISLTGHMSALAALDAALDDDVTDPIDRIDRIVRAFRRLARSSPPPCAGCSVRAREHPGRAPSRDRSASRSLPSTR